MNKYVPISKQHGTVNVVLFNTKHALAMFHMQIWICVICFLRHWLWFYLFPSNFLLPEQWEKWPFRWRKQHTIVAFGCWHRVLKQMVMTQKSFGSSCRQWRSFSSEAYAQMLIEIMNKTCWTQSTLISLHSVQQRSTHRTSKSYTSNREFI